MKYAASDSELRRMIRTMKQSRGQGVLDAFLPLKYETLDTDSLERFHRMCPDDLFADTLGKIVQRAGRAS